MTQGSRYEARGSCVRIMLRVGALWASIIPALDSFPNRRSLAASFTGFARVGWLYYKCSLSFPCLSPVLTAVHPRSPSFRARTPCSLATPASRHAHRPPRGTLHAPTPAHDECAAEDLRPREGHPWERGEGQGAHGDPELRRKQGGELPRLACGLKRVCLRVLSVPTSPSIHTHLNAPTHRLVALAPPSLSASSLPAPVLPPNRHPCA